jgi:uncharacterized protein (TIGR00269 family)
MNCDRCKNTAVYSRRYSGENLCSACFSDSIVRKTAKTISKYRMIQNGQHVCVAVSGGKDSLALLDVLTKMSKNHNFSIHAVTIDEGIPGYRGEALDIVKKFCSDRSIVHSVYSYKELYDLTLDESLKLHQTDRLSSCSICGILRRRAIDHAAKKIGSDVIATGHNMDDVLQTFIINVLSGDTNKIGWQDPAASDNRLRRIKPFCEIYESEIVFYAFTNNLPFQTEPCPHMNEGIRTEIRQFLNTLEGNRSGIKNSMYRSILKISQVMRESNYKQKTKCANCGAECTGKVCSVCKMLLDLRQ